MTADCPEAQARPARHTGASGPASAGGAPESPRTAALRSWELDALRGLAIVLMVLDHLALIFLDGGGDWYRLTLGRASMPLFFVIAGHLVGRLSWRHAAIGALGVAIPLLLPWLSTPNVLLIWACGALVLVGLRRYGISAWWLVLLALTLSANGWGVSFAGSYEVLSLWAFMAAGALLPRSTFTRWGSRLPESLALVGRRPILWYVSHLFILSGVAAALAALSGA